MIKPKEGADLVEGIRLAFNARMFANSYANNGKGSFNLLQAKIDAESELDSWLSNNLDGLPTQQQTDGKEKMQ